ncbi:hypothetical protein QFZ82_007647 [Streptomyces sp. V4I23]|uniref:hypothetical protein n=1 Tax=Streptomyces sp. V4I23 TaxID=3042282 RepID=UPI0027849981|nr:hypothetical protein [Streptomyces sp. V4I23]MDQ1013162.1 hypothetical protein [Streptomyces sp. V4I23]
MISLQFSAENGFIVLLSLLVGWAVYRHSMKNRPGQQAHGDLAVAIGAVAASVLILGFLFGVGDGSGTVDNTPPAPLSSITTRE